MQLSFEHTTELEEGSKPVITTPYRHPKRFKEEIKKTIKESLDMGHIRPNTSPFASFMVLVKKKYGTVMLKIGSSGINFLK